MRALTYLDASPIGTTRVAYTDWGGRANPDVVMCVHGLTRNSRDFDELARSLSDRYRVICVDVQGRGASEWLANPADYIYPNYCSMMWRLIQHLGIKQVDWVGTSMGGIIGMMIAAMPASPISRMVINDVGPYLPKSALQRIYTYLSMNFDFSSRTDIEQHLRKVHEPFGPLTDEQWAHLADHSAHQNTDGRWVLNYDPAIKEPFRDVIEEDISFWEIWDAIRCQVLLIRGKNSDILLRETALEMQSRGPKTDFIEFSGMGHAPALMSADQVSAIKNWLISSPKNQ